MKQTCWLVFGVDFEVYASKVIVYMALINRVGLIFCSS